MVDIRRMNASILLLTLIFAAIIIAPAAAGSSLYVKVKTDKDSYAVGEPMNFIIKIYNDGETAVNDVRVYSTIYGPLNLTGNFKYNIGTLNQGDVKEITISEISKEPGHFRINANVRGSNDKFFGESLLDGSIKSKPSKPDFSTGLVISYMGLLGIIGLLSRKKII